LPGRNYTLMLVPDRDSHIRKLRLSHTALLRAAGGGAVVVLLLLGASIHYGNVVSRVGENDLLRDENAQLKAQLQLVQEKVAHINETLDRVERFDQKLRAITSLSDPERNLAIGPVEAPGMDPEGHSATGAPAKTSVVTSGLGGTDPGLEDHLDTLVDEASRNERSLAELHRYFEEQRSLLASTPSIWPARGWVTSDFGVRLDPYTAERAMHKGLDIANSPGTPVVAPADGVVVFAGTEGGYGNVLVVDHGYGVKTRYGHLSELDVRLGDKIKRGQRVAAIGNTGRSTGPHLHYEVRVNGLPENPRKFILE
jgi:murein DD-endopeptidase MepM/ murein hydrolase activator NlpD